MEYKYEALDQEGKPQGGVINAATEETAIGILQHRGLTLTSFSVNQKKDPFAQLRNITLFGGVSNRDVVILSRQLSTLFEAQISPLRIFQLLSQQANTAYLRQTLANVSDDLQGGSSISQALGKHPKVFSDFYVNMVRAGEETGKLSQTFVFLADQIDRSYDITNKVRNSLIYPAFIIVTFIVVMILMITIIIPRIAAILSSEGGTLPIYTQIILSISAFFVDYGVFLLIGLIIIGYFLFRYVQTPEGRWSVSRLQITLPYIGSLYQKLNLSRIADNLHVMLSSGISTVRSLEITASVISNVVYKDILQTAVEGVKGGAPLHEVFSRYPEEIPAIMVQMLQIGNETGETANILDRLAKFYTREVNTAVDTLVSLIEPAMIILLAVGVGFLLASILLPIYNTTTQL